MADQTGISKDRAERVMPGTAADLRDALERRRVEVPDATPLDLFRVYDLDFVGPDGYPVEWHETIKHAVREAAGHRCVRCLHPYTKGDGEWSPCDHRCDHAGPYRVMDLKQRENVPYWFDIPSKNSLNVPVSNWLAPTGDDTFEIQAEYWAVEARWRILTIHHLNGSDGRKTVAGSTSSPFAKDATFASSGSS